MLVGSKCYGSRKLENMKKWEDMLHAMGKQPTKRFEKKSFTEEVSCERTPNKRDSFDQNTEYVSHKKKKKRRDNQNQPIVKESTQEYDNFDLTATEGTLRKRKKRRHGNFNETTPEGTLRKRKKRRHGNFNETITEEITQPVDEVNLNGENDEERKITKVNTRDNTVSPNNLDRSLNTTEPSNAVMSDSSSDKLEEDDQYDLTEEYLNFEPPLLHFKGHCLALTAEQRNQIKEQGIAVRYGKWDEKEDEILKRNWKNFVKKHNLKKPHLLLGLQTERDPMIIKFSQAKKLYFHLGKDLVNRPLHSVYLRARKLFNPYQNKQETTPDVREKIERLQSIHGNKWTVIGNILQRNSRSISEIARWQRKEKALGAWTKEEDENLIKAIKHVLKVEDLAKVYQGIPWEEVAKLVPSRNAKQCRAHWMLNLCWKINNPNKTREKWNDVHTIRLIRCIYNLSAKKEKDLDWTEIFNKFSNIASYAALHSKWTKIKQKVPKHEKNNFEDIVCYLNDVYAPRLLSKLEKSNDEILNVS